MTPTNYEAYKHEWLNILNSMETIYHAIDKYVFFLTNEVENGKVSNGTLSAYHSIFDLFKNYLELFGLQDAPLYKLHSIYTDFVEYREQTTGRYISESTNNKNIYAFNSLLAYAYENDLSKILFRMPSQGKVEVGEPKYISPIQLKNILSEASLVRNGFMYHLIIRLLYETGCTVKELVSLKASNFNFEKNEIYINKVSRYKERILRVTEELMEEAKQYIKFRMIKPEGYMFSAENKKQYTPDNIQAKLREIIYNAKIQGISAQSFRDTYAVNLVLKGSTIDELISCMGMTDRQRATRYVVFFERNKEELQKLFSP